LATVFSHHPRIPCRKKSTDLAAIHESIQFFTSPKLEDFIEHGWTKGFAFERYEVIITKYILKDFGVHNLFY